MWGGWLRVVFQEGVGNVRWVIADGLSERCGFVCDGNLRLVFQEGVVGVLWV